MAVSTLTYGQRLDALRAAKLEQTREKQEVLGAMDHDDWAVVLPPPELREVIDAISGSGEPITDCIFKGWHPQSNHPSGGFFGPRAVGDNYRDFLEHHPEFMKRLKLHRTYINIEKGVIVEAYDTKEAEEYLHSLGYESD